MTTKPPPAQPPWGKIVQEHRKSQGRSIRQVSTASGISDSYWGQVERGYQTKGDRYRVISPSRSKLIEIAETLRLSPADTNHLLTAADFHPLADSDVRAVGRGESVDVRGLTIRDVRLLNVIADRIRETVPAHDAAPTREPLRAVASEQSGPAGQAEASVKAKRARRRQGET